jgi:hypothetical protein
MAFLEDTAVHLPIRGGHNYAGITGYDNTRQQLGDNYFINQSGFNIRTYQLCSLPDFPDLTSQ